MGRFVVGKRQVRKSQVRLNQVRKSKAKKSHERICSMGKIVIEGPNEEEWSEEEPG